MSALSELHPGIELASASLEKQVEFGNNVFKGSHQLNGTAIRLNVVDEDVFISYHGKMINSFTPSLALIRPSSSTLGGYDSIIYADVFWGQPYNILPPWKQLVVHYFAYPVTADGMRAWIRSYTREALTVCLNGGIVTCKFDDLGNPVSMLISRAKLGCPSLTAEFIGSVKRSYLEHQIAISLFVKASTDIICFRLLRGLSEIYDTPLKMVIIHNSDGPVSCTFGLAKYSVTRKYAELNSTEPYFHVAYENKVVNQGIAADMSMALLNSPIKSLSGRILSINQLLLLITAAGTGDRVCSVNFQLSKDVTVLKSLFKV